MESKVADAQMREAIEMIAAGVDALFDCGLEPADSRDAVAVIREVEVLRRRVDAAAVDTLAAVEAKRQYVADGHGSAKVMVRHCANLSNTEAAARHKTARMMGDLDKIAGEYRAGRIGSCQVRLLGRVHANRRVRDAMGDRQQAFLNRANRPYTDFDRKLREWERITDEDGPTPAAERSHQNRDVSFIQDYNLTWHLSGSMGAFAGAAFSDIFEHYIHAEYLSDWEKARAEHGDHTTEDHLPRTAAQRRADALWQMAQDAAASPTGAVPPGFMHNIVWNEPTWNETLRRLDGRDPIAYDSDTYKCETINGTPVDPTEAALNSLTGLLRRVVIDAASTTIDLGVARNFTGSSRHAVKLQHNHCIWPGCTVPTTQCETDHLTEHSRNGRTNPGNGAPLCGRHNRWKQKGFTIWRDPTGQWHIHRPDGTKLD